MTRKTYTAEYKTKLVLEAIREESRLEEIAAANEINPNMLRNWEQEFLKNASSVFSQKESKAAKRLDGSTGRTKPSSTRSRMRISHGR